MQQRQRGEARGADGWLGVFRDCRRSAAPAQQIGKPVVAMRMGNEQVLQACEVHAMALRLIGDFGRKVDQRGGWALQARTRALWAGGLNVERRALPAILWRA